MRNYYSMTAVLQGLTWGCFYSQELDSFYGRTNPANNYQGITDGIPALHSTFLAEKDIQFHGDSSALVQVLNASEGYWRYWWPRTFFPGFLSYV